MSNGAACCAAQVCCPDAAERMKKLPPMIAKATGLEEEYCVTFLEWMAHEDLMFAPAEFGATVKAILEMADRRHP